MPKCKTGNQAIIFVRNPGPVQGRVGNRRISPLGSPLKNILATGLLEMTPTCQPPKTFWHYGSAIEHGVIG